MGIAMAKHGRRAGGLARVQSRAAIARLEQRKGVSSPRSKTEKDPSRWRERNRSPGRPKG